MRLAGNIATRENRIKNTTGTMELVAGNFLANNSPTSGISTNSGNTTTNRQEKLNHSSPPFACIVKRAFISYMTFPQASAMVS